MEVRVSVSCFVSPHLFWVIDTREETPLLLNGKIQNLWQDSNSQQFDIGEIVATKHNNKFYRAEIKCINDDSYLKKYMCWLIDYGILFETNTLCKLPKHLQILPPVAIQASLNNVAYLLKQLSYQDGYIPVILEKPSTTYTPASRSIALPLIKNAKMLTFRKDDIIDGVWIGDLFYEKDNKMHSLRGSLCEQQILTVDEKLFTEIISDIHNFKEKHLQFIHQISEQSEILNEESPIKFYDKYLEGIEDKDFEEGRTSITFSNRSSTTKESESESDSVSCSGSKGASSEERRKLNLDLFRQKMSKPRLDEEDANSSNSDVPMEKTKPLSPQEKYLAQMKAHQSTSDDSSKESKATTHKISKSKPAIQQPKVIVTAAGTRLGGKRSAPKNSNIPPNRSPIPIGHEGTRNASKTIRSSSETSLNSQSNRTYNENCSTSGCNELKPTVMNVKPACSCTQCMHWQQTLPQRELKIATEYNNTPKRVPFVGCKAPPFLKKPDTPVSKVIAFDYEKLSKVEHLQMPKVLLHGATIPIRIKSVVDAGFHQDIHKSLNDLGYKETLKTQTYIWPSILRQQHTCVIHNPRTGKTFSYLPVLCSFILEKNDYYKEFPKTGGPIIVILCRNSKKCENVYGLILKLLKYSRTRVTVWLATNLHTPADTSNVDILVAPPAIFLALVANVINLKRLCHFVIDDADVVVRKHNNTIQKVIKLIDEMIEHRKTISRKVQLIMCGEHWNNQIKEIAGNLHEIMFVCIPNMLEAAVYGDIQFRMQFLQTAMKEMEIRSLLKERYHIFRSVIFCKEPELKILEEILMLEGIEYSIITATNTDEDNLLLEQSWKMDVGGKYRVLVITDEGFNAALVSIINASIIVHYSLPDSWTNFVKRFGCLLENIKSPFDEDGNAVKNESYVLLDASCVDKSLYRFIRFLKEVNISIRPELEECYENVRQKKEQDKIAHDCSLCEELKMFGKCADINCTARHALDFDLDVRNVDLPRNGTVKFKIIDILDVTHFTVKLINYKDLNGNVKDVRIEENITEYLTEVMLEKQKTCVENVRLNYQYCYLNDGKFYRCLVLSEKDGEFEVQLLDIGTIEIVQKKSLYKLPNRYRSEQHSVINVYLANFIPPFRDETFPHRNLEKLQDLLKKKNYQHAEYTGQIYLQLNDNLWLKNVVEEVEIDDILACKFKLCRNLLDLKLVEESCEPLNNLYALCAKSNIELPVYEVEVKKEVKILPQSKPQWAFFEYDNVNEVIFSSAVSPSEFYVRLMKFNSLLYQLQQDIQQAVKRKTYHRAFDVSVGKCCLAQEAESGDWGRVQIVKIDGAQVLCYFVDFGDEIVVERKDLKYLSNDFIEKLPFQSIQCSLYGVKPVLETWQDEATDILYKYSYIPECDDVRSLFVKCCGKERTSTGQYSYKVILKDGFGSKNVLISNLLIDCGTALNVAEEIVEDFEIPRQQQVSDDEEEFSDLEEIRNEEEFSESEEEVDGVSCIKQIGDMEICIFNCFEAFNELNFQCEESQVQPKPLKQLPALTPSKIETTSPCAKVPMNSDTGNLVPTVKWSQSDKYLKLNIMLVDAENYTVSLTRTRVLNFKAHVMNRNYAFTWVLFDKVKSVQHTTIGPQIRVVLTKNIEVLWPRLLFSKDKVPNLQYDLATIQIEEEKPKRILTLPDEFGENIAGDSDDEDKLNYFDISDRESIYGDDLDLSSDEMQ